MEPTEPKDASIHCTAERIAMQAVESEVLDGDSQRSALALWQKTAQSNVLENGSRGAVAAPADAPQVHKQWNGSSSSSNNQKGAASLSTHSVVFSSRSLRGATDDLGPGALQMSVSVGAVMESLPDKLLTRQSVPMVNRGFTFDDVVRLAQERHLKTQKGQVGGLSSHTGMVHACAMPG